MLHDVNRGAEELRVAMARRKINQAEVAALADSSQAQVSAWARGVSKPGRRSAFLLDQKLGIDPLWWDEPAGEAA